MTTAPRSLRFFFIALAGVSLLLALWTGVIRLGWPLSSPNFLAVSLHGPLVVIGFLVTLIGLERAAAVDRWWVYGVPLLGILSVLALLIGLPVELTALLAAGAALILTLFFIQLYRRHHEEHFVVMALSAAALCFGNLLWLAEFPLLRAVPWWVAFLVLMIAGERLELTRLRRPALIRRFWTETIIFWSKILECWMILSGSPFSGKSLSRTRNRFWILWESSTFWRRKERFPGQKIGGRWGNGALFQTIRSSPMKVSAFVI